MAEVSIGGRHFVIHAAASDECWTAYADDAETGKRFGVEVTARTRDEAIGRLTAWLGWQLEHAQALGALQEVERGYHRLIAGTAFASVAEAPSSDDLQEWLQALDAARAHLDEVRGRKPL